MLYPQVHQLCCYKDKAKSKPHLDSNLKMQNLQALDYCNFEQGYISRGGQCRAGDSIESYYELYCNNCKNLVAVYKVPDGKDPDFEVVDFRYTENLMAMRQRPDEALGLECICNNNDTRLWVEEKNSRPEEFEGIKTTTTEEAKFSSAKSSYTAKEVHP